MPGFRFAEWLMVARLPLLRAGVALHLRRLAERLAPRRQALGGRPSAPLVRFDGRWWHRDEIVDPAERPPEQ